MHETDPEITVVLPTRDRWGLARDALASALAQRDVTLEVCIVDDGSSTRAPSDFTDDPRVRLFRHEESSGVASARNWAIREARGSWIAFLDDDDVWAPWHLCRLMASVRDEQACWGFSWYVVTKLDRTPVFNGPSAPLESDPTRQFLGMNPLGTTSCALVATEALRALGGFDEQLSLMADWDLWLRLLATSPPAVSGAFTVGYALHVGSMCLDINRICVEREQMASRHRPALERFECEFADSPHFWRWFAFRCAWSGRRALAARHFLVAASVGGGARDVVRAVSLVPLAGSPIRLARSVVAVLRSRSHRRRGTSPEHAWLQAFAGRADSERSGRASVAGAISQRWRVRTRPSP